MKEFSFCCFLIVLFALGCQGENPADSSTNLEPSTEGLDTDLSEEIKLIQSEEGPSQYGSIVYDANLMSSIEFIKRRGEVPRPEDFEQLKKEHVLILEVEDLEALTGTHISKRLLLNEEDLNSYMMSGIINDVKITQDSIEHYPHTVHFDKDIGNSGGRNKLRAFLFFNDLENKNEMKIKYYDRLFGAGEMQL